MNTPTAITVHFDGDSSPAVITGRVSRGWYVVGHHFGMVMHEDQHIGAPEFDPSFKVTWEETDATDEHRRIATNVGERLS